MGVLILVREKWIGLILLPAQAKRTQYPWSWRLGAIFFWDDTLKTSSLQTMVPKSVENTSVANTSHDGNRGVHNSFNQANEKPSSPKTLKMLHGMQILNNMLPFITVTDARSRLLKLLAHVACNGTLADSDILHSYCLDVRSTSSSSSSSAGVQDGGREGGETGAGARGFVIGSPKASQRASKRAKRDEHNVLAMGMSGLARVAIFGLNSDGTVYGDEAGDAAEGKKSGEIKKKSWLASSLTARQASAYTCVEKSAFSLLSAYFVRFVLLQHSASARRLLQRTTKQLLEMLPKAYSITSLRLADSLAYDTLCGAAVAHTTSLMENYVLDQCVKSLRQELQPEFTAARKLQDVEYMRKLYHGDDIYVSSLHSNSHINGAIAPLAGSNPSAAVCWGYRANFDLFELTTQKIANDLQSEMPNGLRFLTQQQFLAICAVAVRDAADIVAAELERAGVRGGDAGASDASHGASNSGKSASASQATTRFNEPEQFQFTSNGNGMDVGNGMAGGLLNSSAQHLNNAGVKSMLAAASTLRTVLGKPGLGGYAGDVAARSVYASLAQSSVTSLTDGAFVELF